MQCLFGAWNCYPKPLAAVILYTQSFFGETSGSERTGDSRFRIAGWDGNHEIRQLFFQWNPEIHRILSMKSWNPSDFSNEILKSITFYTKTLISVGDRREVPHLKIYYYHGGLEYWPIFCRSKRIFITKRPSPPLFFWGDLHHDAKISWAWLMMDHTTLVNLDWRNRISIRDEMWAFTFWFKYSPEN